ncbi:PilN domain-containing protein [Inediibacterium massiliense]|uniref:PilN domain-containing protein n=1 Tax=Inediibacterium massiliense TaxID=1658111 RepID=UPI0006B485D0|nr:PilN domain-containing protein [Inediibacterium massiliense]
MDFNFFSPYINTKKTYQKKKTYGVFIGIFIISILFMSIYWYHHTIEELKKQAHTMENIIQSKKTHAQLQKIQEKQEKINIMEKYYKTLIQLDDQIDDLSFIHKNFFITLSNTIPEEISLNVMNLSLEELQIQGISKNRTAIAELEHNLKNLDTFENVHIPNITADEENGYTFTILCKLKDVKK